MKNVKPYRIKAKIQNNRLWRSILEVWPDVKTQTEAGKRLGLDPMRIGNLLNLKSFPAKTCAKRGLVWSHDVIKICEFLGESPEYLFDPRLYGKDKLRPKLVELEVGIAELADRDLAQITAPDPYQEIEKSDLRERVNKALATLPPRSEMVMRARMGDEPQTFQQIGNGLHRHRNNIWAIAKKAEKMLRHESRTKYLKDLI